MESYDKKGKGNSNLEKLKAMTKFIQVLKTSETGI